MIKLSNVCKSFSGAGGFKIKEVSFQVGTGEILVILGSSGCGKTTILKMINRLIEPTTGMIEINNRSVFDYDPVTLRRSIGYTFQKIGLFPHMTVAENISVVLRLMRHSKAYRRNRARELLQLVNLDPNIFADRLVEDLSGGQQQRVSVARALANNPDILLMDEPFGALDTITRSSLQSELLRLNMEVSKTIVFVTHDIMEALRLADRIAVMHKGKIEQIGTKKEIIQNPVSDFVKNLVQIPSQQYANFSDHLE